MAVRGHPGEYDQPVAVWKNVPVPNDDGQPVETPVKTGDFWASVRQRGSGGLFTGGGEKIIQEQKVVNVTHTVRTWSNAFTRALDETYHLKLRDNTRLDITRVFDIDLRKTEVLIACTERK